MKKTTELSGKMKFTGWEKKLLIMKLTTILFLISIVSIHANVSYSQSKMLNLNVKKEPIHEVLSKIEAQSEFNFMYSAKVVDVNRLVTINVKDAKIDEILKSIFAGTDVVYTLKDKFIVLAAAEYFDALIHHQSVKVTGIVTDAGTREPLPGVNITIEGTTLGVITDANGKYSIELAYKSQVLVFSCIGYNTERISLAGQSVVDVQLIPDIKSLEEVVVVGYGSVKKSDLTGSVTSIRGEDMKRATTTSLDGKLQGRAPGVQVTQTSGQPGGGVSIRIRGSNSISAGNEPLYVIDGLPIYNDNSTMNYNVTSSGDQNPLATIDAQNIESIEILKDASATAIYGSRGANGVILITTKQGSKGKNKVTFDTSFGMQEIRHMIPVMNATEFAEFANEAHRNGQIYMNRRADPGEYSVYTKEQIESFGEGTNWQKEIFRTAPRSDYNLTISGGTENTTYAVTCGYLNQQGIIINSDFKRATLRVNLDQKISDRLNVGTNLSVSRSWANTAYADAGSNVGNSTSVVLAALSFNPILPVRDPVTGEYTYQNAHDGKGGGNYQAAVPYYNPVAYAEQAVNQNITNRILGTMFAKYKIWDDLSLKSNFGADILANNQNHFVPSSVSIAAAQKGVARIGSVQSYTLTNENILNYNKVINEIHNIDFIAGVSFQKFYQESLRASANNFASDEISYFNIGAGSVQSPSSSQINDWAMLSYITRVNYKFTNKYLLTLTARADGSSRFGEGNRFGYFPSGAFAWRVSDESFMKSLSAVSNLKFRTSYGLTGNQELPLYQSVSVLNETRYVLNNAAAVGFYPRRIANPDLKWETTRQFDVGFDLGLFKDRLRVTMDYYEKRTSDLLLEVFLPTSSGFSTAFQNIGSTLNKGIEFSIDVNLLSGPVNWDFGFNIANNKNKVINLGGESERLIIVPGFHQNSQPVSILRVGESLGNFYGYATDGFFSNQAEIDAAPNQTPLTGQIAIPGCPKFVDQNGDNVINTLDKTIIGNAMPDFIGGFSTHIAFKAFDLNAQFTYSVGNEILNANRQWLEAGNGRHNNTKDKVNRWSPQNTEEENSYVKTGIAANPTPLDPFTVYDRWIEDGSYLRMSSIQFGYNIPASKLKALKLTHARIYLSGQNLLTVTKYSGFDPEVNRFGQDNILRGFDVSGYPTAKTYLIGISIGL